MQAVFGSFFDLRKFFFGALGNEFGKFYPILIIIHIEIAGLVIIPLEFFILNPVLPKLYGINLGFSKIGTGNK